MKKKVWAGAIAAAVATAAHAQSSVTLYGIIDDGLTYVSNAGGHSLFKLDDGINQASRWGLKGAEDLGGGLKAIFTLENGFSLNTGTASHGGALFGRRAFVGLSSDTFGTLIAGYDYDFIYDYVSYYTNVAQFAPSYAFHGAYDIDRLAGEPVSNMVRYETPNWHGFGAGVMYGFSNIAGAFGGTPTGNPRVISGGIKYSPTGTFNAPYSMAAVITKTDGGNAARGVGTMAQVALDAESIYTVAVGGMVNVNDAWSINGVYTYTNASKSPLGVVTVSAYEAGTSYRFSPMLTVGGGFTYVDQHKLGKYNLYSAGVDYRLSKRTDVYLFGVFQHAFAGQKFADSFLVSTPYSVPGAGGSLYGNLASTTANQLAVQIGIRHLF
ncbi:porin [Paraburkholderia lycopersici]|uniref:Outer membrane protein (Porin) n=1 Tax=Paraburkholderia lycopersici TaxID=416944 RepID=A0A1G6HA09_9BURK|nr:porin [Paraburkholderia lycopersici]SDB90765.1 Outer membrane protein (porin) [Paraburkholderia lycopersici]